MADSVSWLLIEPGWRVEDSDGGEVGRVEAVTGDSSEDIFDGLAIAASAFARPRYVPAEQIGEITEGVVRLKLDHAAVESLSEYEEPAVEEEIEAEPAGRLARAEAFAAAPGTSEHRVGLLRRVLLYLGLTGRR